MSGGRGSTPRRTTVRRAGGARAGPGAARRSAVTTPVSATGSLGLEEVRQDLLLRDLRALQLGAHSSPVHDVGPAGEVEDLRQVRRNQEDTRAGLLHQILHEVVDLDGEKLGARAVLDTREEGLERAARHEF